MHRGAGQFEPALPLSQHSQIHAADRRNLWPAAQLLGHRHHPHAVLVERVRDDVHRGDAVAEGPRPRARHGPRGLRLARLEPARLMICPSPRVRVRGLVVAAILLAGFGNGAAAAADDAALDALVRAYPEGLAGYDATYLIWRDGTRMPHSDGRPDKTL